jgi:glycosyltransferase involved in cell wall biosynthesis
MPSTLPLVSIVIPCYNQGWFLRSALRSVQEGQYGATEIIVVNDGSDDDTGTVARQSGAHVIDQPNRGLSMARNAGLASARGEFIVFLDADDELLPDTLLKGVAVFSARPGLACVLRYCLLIDADGQPLATRPPEVLHRDIYAELLYRNVTWSPGAAMFRRLDVARAGGFPTDVSPAADYALYLRFARERRLVYVPQPGVRYRQHGDNMSKDLVAMLLATLKVLEAERRAMPREYRTDWRKARRAWCDLYGDRIIDALRLQWRQNRRSLELGGVLTLLRYSPHVLMKHAKRKLARLVRGLPSTAVEPSGWLSTAASRSRDARR